MTPARHQVSATDECGPGDTSSPSNHTSTLPQEPYEVSLSSETPPSPPSHTHMSPTPILLTPPAINASSSSCYESPSPTLQKRCPKPTNTGPPHKRSRSKV